MSRHVVLRPVREEMPFEPTDELRGEGRLVLATPSAVPRDTFGLGIRISVR